MVANIRGFTTNYSFKLINFDTPRWHTLEYSNWNMVDALLLQSGTPQIRGGWQNNTAYLEGDRVFDEDTSATYRCLVSHTSALSGSFVDDRILHPTYWSLQLSGVPVFRDAWMAGVAYVLGDIVSYNEYTFYLCTFAHTAGATFPPDAVYWQQVFDASQVVIDSEAAKDAAYQFSLDAQDSANDAQSSANDAQSSEDDAAGWANDARAATGGFRWAYSSATAAADPAAGRVAFNSANPLAVTQIYLSAFSSEIGNPDVSDWVITWDDSMNVLTRGTLQLRKIGQPEQFMIFELKGNITDNGTWMLLPVAYTSHSGTITNGEALSVGFVRAGNQGPTGTGGGDMLIANNLNELTATSNTARANIGVGPFQIPTFSQVLLGNDPSQTMHAATKQYVDNSPSLVVSDTAPNPTTSLPGTLWWDSDLGTLYVLYSDGDSKQWVQAVATPGIDTTPLVKKAGDTMTGDLTIAKANPQIALNKSAVNQNNAITGLVASSPRWQFVLGDTNAETGSNAGSGFGIYRFSDTGAFLDEVIHGFRDTGLLQIKGDPTIPLGVATKQYVDARVLDVAAYSGMQINGGMEVSQERGVGGAAITNSSAPIADVFRFAISGTGTVGIQQQTVAPPGFTNSVLLNCTAISTLAGANDYQWFEQRIEGYRWSRLGWGAAGAQPVTIGFWIQPLVSGTMAVAIQTTVSPFRTYVVDVPVTAAVWQYKTVTIPGDVGGTWNKDNLVGATIYFVFGVGSGRKTTANVWATQGTAVGTAATTNFFATTGFTYITGVVVLPGSQAPTAAQSPMIMRPYDQELATCKRYYEARRFSASAGDVTAWYQQAGTFYFFWDFSVQKRATPSFAVVSGSWVGPPTVYPTSERILFNGAAAFAIISGTAGNISCAADARL